MLHTLGIPVELDVPGKLYDLFAKNGLIATTVVFIVAFFWLLRVHLHTIGKHATTTRAEHKEVSEKFERIVADLRTDAAENRAAFRLMADSIKDQKKPRRAPRKPAVLPPPRKVQGSDD